MNKKPLFLILIFLLLCGSIASYFVFKFQTKKELQTKEEALNIAVLKTTDFINEFFQKVEKEISQFLEAPELNHYLTDIESGFQEGVHSQKYQASKETFSNYLSMQPKAYLLNNLVFVSKNGDIIYGEGLGRNIYKNKLANSELALSLTRTHLTQTEDVSRFIYNLSKKQKELYFTLPLGSARGVISFPINLNTLLRQIEKNGEDIALFQLKDNNFSILSSSFSSDQGKPFVEAMNGRQGSGITVIGQKKVIGSWNFIPRLNWGIIKGVDYSFVTDPMTHWKWASFILMALFLVSLVIFLAIVFKTVWLTSRFFKFFTIVLFIVSLFGVSYAIYNIHLVKKNRLLDEELKIRRDLFNFAQIVSNDLEDITHTTDWLAKDLTSGRLKEDDLLLRLERDFKETPALQKIVVTFDDSPLSFEANRKDGVIKTKSSGIASNTLLETPNKWTTFFDDETEKEMGIYVSPFSGQKKGVVKTYYDISKLANDLDSLSLGSIGTGFLILKEGLIPGTDISSRRIEQRIQQGKFYPFQDNRTREEGYFLIEKITNTSWIIGAQFKTAYLQIEGSEIQELSFLLITWIWLALIALLALFCRNGHLFSGIYILLTACALISIWTVKYFSYEDIQVDGLIVKDKATLDNFISSIQKNASDMLLEEPVFVPTGIWVQFLELQKSNSFTFSGLAWQKRPKNTSLTDIFFPQAALITLDKIPSPPDSLIQNWRVRATLGQKRDSGPFPFDNNLIKIQISNLEINPSIFLIPDLESYKQYAPRNKPGIDPNFTLPGYDLNQTFFSLEKESYELQNLNDVGGKVQDRYALYYNIYLVRDFLIPFIPFLIPLIVIQIGMYAIFLMTKKERGINFMTSISVYTGGFFAFAILQLNLRTQYAGDSILYAETFFFVGYFLISLLYFHAFLMKNSPKNSLLNRSKHILNLIFWPIQLTLWYLITLIYFY